MLYLHKSLVKASTKQLGEQRGGKYVARVQTGVSKDGSPIYRYFRTSEEYKTYIENKAKIKDEDSKKANSKEDKKIKEKVAREQKKSEKQQERDVEKLKQDLLSSGRKGRKSVDKSLRLYIGK